MNLKRPLKVESIYEIWRRCFELFSRYAPFLCILHREFRFWLKYRIIIYASVIIYEICMFYFLLCWRCGDQKILHIHIYKKISFHKSIFWTQEVSKHVNQVNTSEYLTEYNTSSTYGIRVMDVKWFHKLYY